MLKIFSLELDKSFKNIFAFMSAVYIYFKIDEKEYCQ
jgi:hypothetical protein